MNRGVFIVGTDTDVGKTVITAGLAYVLKKNGLNVCTFKAVQSGGISRGEKIVSGDTMLVKKVCNIDEDLDLMNPYCLKTPVSPHLAAQLEGIEIDSEKIIDTYQKLSQKYDFIIAEGSGGLVVPINDEGYFVYDLIKDLDLPIIIVARANVGTINHTVLTVKYAESLGLDIQGIIINRYNDEFYERDNIKMIKKLTGQDIIAVINEIRDFDCNGIEFNELQSEFEKKIDTKKILNTF